MTAGFLTVKWPDTLSPGYDAEMRNTILEKWIDEGMGPIALGPDGQPIVPIDWQERIMGK